MVFAEWAASIGLAMPSEPDEIYPALLPVWNAFWILSRSRPIGISAGAIPWEEASCFCEDHGIVGQQKLRWIRLLRAMDEVFLDVHAEEVKSRRARGNP